MSRDDRLPATPTYTLHYERRLVRRAVGCFVRWRLFGSAPRLWLAQGLLVGAAAVLAADRSWGWAIACMAITVSHPLLVLMGWAAHLRYKLRTLRAMGSPVAAVTVDADTWRFRSGAGELVLPLSEVMDWREHADFWLLLTAPNRFIVLPTAGLPAAVLATLREHLQAIGRDR